MKSLVVLAVSTAVVMVVVSGKRGGWMRKCVEEAGFSEEGVAEVKNVFKRPKPERVDWSTLTEEERQAKMEEMRAKFNERFESKLEELKKRLESSPDAEKIPAFEACIREQAEKMKDRMPTTKAPDAATEESKDGEE